MTTLSYIHDGDVKATFMRSVLNARDYEHDRGRTFTVSPRHCAAGGLAHARNLAAANFLDGDDDWFWSVDTDMLFAPASLALMRQTTEDYPVVCGLAFSLSRDGHDPETGASYYKPKPTIYRYNSDGLLNTVLDYERNAVVECDASGGAFSLIHRSVFEAVGHKYDAHWYDQIPHPTQHAPYGEDISFFLRARACGFPVVVDTSIRTGHDKGGVVLTEKLYLQQRARST